MITSKCKHCPFLNRFKKKIIQNRKQGRWHDRPLTVAMVCDVSMTAIPLSPSSSLSSALWERDLCEDLLWFPLTGLTSGSLTLRSGPPFSGLAVSVELKQITKLFSIYFAYYIHIVNSYLENIASHITYNMF